MRKRSGSDATQSTRGPRQAGPAPSPPEPHRGPSRIAGRGQAGYTATEMMVAGAVLAMATVVGLSSVGNVVPVTRAKSAAQQVASAIRQARQYAVANGASYTVTLTGTTIAVSCTANCPPGAPSDPETALVHGAATSVPEPPLEFGPMGTTDQPASIVVTYPGAPAWEVQVTAAGAVRSCSPGC